MRAFMEEDFLLSTETARHLYHDYAEQMPIIDYHCHLSPREIAEDIRFDNIAQVWLGGDHYKWRQMRWNGVEEKYITGDAPDREKFQKWAETLELAIGNPLYHWSHLELKRYFGYDGILNGRTAGAVWDLCNEKLAQPEMSARNLIRNSGVKVVCTTDDPADTLEWHKKIREESSAFAGVSGGADQAGNVGNETGAGCGNGFDVKVLPAWRPDKAMNIGKTDYTDYLAKLGAAAGVTIDSYASLMEALKKRMDFFETMGCRVCDHGLPGIIFEPASADEVEKVFAKRLSGAALTKKEERQFRTAFMLDMGRAAAAKGWVMQLHYGVQRDLNRKVFAALGPDAGIDAIGDTGSPVEMGRFLNALAETDQLPKTIIYSLNPADNAAIGSVIGCFEDSSAVAKIQHGAAWWFNDNKTGMQDQLVSLANLGLLGNFVGMLTDSRSFISYPRHEYFRRILCDLIGGWVENGEYPADEEALEKIIKGISYGNAKRYFGL